MKTFLSVVIAFLVMLAMVGTIYGAFAASDFWGGVCALGWALLLGAVLIDMED